MRDADDDRPVGGDNTPQGKITRGCASLLSWIAGMMVLITVIAVVERMLDQ